MMNCLPFRYRLPHAAAWLIALTLSTTGRAAPFQAVFEVDPASSSLAVQASALGFSDTDTQGLDGTINATFDFGTKGFGLTAQVTITGASVTPLADYNLTLGFPPLLGAAINASGLVASVSTDSPPAIMNRTPLTAAEYTVGASRFPITVNQGNVVVTGSINESFSLADNPVAGTSPPATRATLLFTTAATTGPFTRINATLNLPVDVTDSFTTDGGVTVDVHLTATVVATASFDAGLKGDFNQDGHIDGRDFLAWQRGESFNPLSVGDLADWQENYGAGSLIAESVADSTTRSVVLQTVPEPSTVGLLLGLIFVGRARNRSHRAVRS
jgi:hypothetical protein